MDSVSQEQFRRDLETAVFSAQQAVTELVRLIGVYDGLTSTASARTQHHVAPEDVGAVKRPKKFKPSLQQLQCFWALRRVGATSSSSSFASTLRVVENLGLVATASGKEAANASRVGTYLSRAAKSGYLLVRAGEYQLTTVAEEILDRRMRELRLRE